MKTPMIFSLIAACVIALAMPSVLAAEANAKTMPMSSILQNLQAAGYVAVKEVKFADGLYKAEAINDRGEKVKVNIDPKTGEITKPKSTQSMLSMVDVVKKVEAAGYYNIHEVESDKGEYEVKALDKDGKGVELKVDAVTGKVTK